MDVVHDIVVHVSLVVHVIVCTYMHVLFTFETAGLNAIYINRVLDIRLLLSLIQRNSQ